MLSIIIFVVITATKSKLNQNIWGNVWKILKRKRKTIKKTKIVSADDADECMCISSYDSREKKTQMLQLNQMITHQCSAVSNEFDFEGTTFPAALFDVGHVILLFHLNHSKTYVWTYKETDTLKGSSFFLPRPHTGLLGNWTFGVLIITKNDSVTFELETIFSCMKSISSLNRYMLYMFLNELISQPLPWHFYYFSVYLYSQ